MRASFSDATSGWLLGFGRAFEGGAELFAHGGGVGARVIERAPQFYLGGLAATAFDMKIGGGALARPLLVGFAGLLGGSQLLASVVQPRVWVLIGEGAAGPHTVQHTCGDLIGTPHRDDLVLRWGGCC
ncbi:hypothetical protein [Actinomadura nitritigenes]|uniref:hypothetical protein n=1 Tax=Actinomadura nitritigenes TaxID=134602 RepID=UPI003D9070C6